GYLHLADTCARRFLGQKACQRLCQVGAIGVGGASTHRVDHGGIVGEQPGWGGSLSIGIGSCVIVTPGALGPAGEERLVALRSASKVGIGVLAGRTVNGLDTKRIVILIESGINSRTPLPCYAYARS